MKTFDGFFTRRSDVELAASVFFDVVKTHVAGGSALEEPDDANLPTNNVNTEK